MMRFAALLALAMLPATTPASPRDAQEGGYFVQRELGMDGSTHRYQVFVPARHADGSPPAVILFLHGSGERGSDGQRQTEAGLGPYVRANAGSFPSLVVFPQSPEGRSWDGATADMALAALDESVREFGGDPRRVYLTGMSRGGYGTYGIALQEPQRFAALVPVCGGITTPRVAEPLRVGAVAAEQDPFAAAAQRLKRIPTWIFHGARDEVVPPGQSRRMFAALQAAGAADARYTELPEAGHNSWDAAYGDDAMWTWLFAQHRP
jgi:predicted peptidase